VLSSLRPYLARKRRQDLPFLDSTQNFVSDAAAKTVFLVANAVEGRFRVQGEFGCLIEAGRVLVHNSMGGLFEQGKPSGVH